MFCKYNVNKSLVTDMLEALSNSKKAMLAKALERNCYLTSAYVLEHGTLRVYKEGWYLQLFGTKCTISVFFFDNDGVLVEAKRKPNENKLSFLYEESLHFNESDFRNF